MKSLKAGAIYFALVFGAGFVLGVVRVIWIVPRLGIRTAELLEAPFMLLIIILAARWVVRNLALQTVPKVRLGAGFVALSFLLFAELTIVLGVRHLTLAQYLAGRDIVAGIVYAVMLLVFAAMPLLVVRS